MINGRRAIGLALLAAACGGPGSRAPYTPQPLAVYPPRDLVDRRPQTRAERSGFTATSSHADVMAFIDTLKANSKDIFVTSMGRTSQGKDIPLLIMSRPLVKTPADAKRLHRPIVFVQGNIHGGEVEGKEALLALLRDLQRDRYENIVDSIIILAAPIYNADGNDAFGPQAQTRSEQNGPALAGQRANAQGFDLNRDYIKAEAPETKASLELFRTWEPDVFVDLHTTDGSFHGYALTWSPSLNPAARFAGPFTRDTILPLLRRILKQHERLETFPYGNFMSQDSASRGWFTYDHRPRFGTNYYGLRGRMSILSEAYSHDPFKTRIASTYAFVYELLSIIAANRDDILEVGQEADRRTTAFASTMNRGPFIPIRSRMTRSPYMDDVLIEDLTRTSDTVRGEPGVPVGWQRTGKVRTIHIPVYDRFEGTHEQIIPYAWAIGAEQAAVIEPLRRHGLFIEELAANATLRVERFAIDSVVRSARPFQGHQETRLTGQWETSDTLTLAPGTFIVRGGQPLGILAMYLLEPLSDDGLVTWNFLDPWLRPGARYPVTRVLSPINAALRPSRDR